MRRSVVTSMNPVPTASALLIRSVYGGFAGIVLLICAAAALSYQGIQHIHAEAGHSLRSIPSLGLTHTNVDQLIASQSHMLLVRVEMILAICCLAAFACGAVTVWTVNASLSRIQTQSDELNYLSWRITQEHEVVARRFSHEIHDEFGQMLTGLRILLQQATPERFEESRPECLALIDDALTNVRELSQLLRPVILDDFGLNEALLAMTRRLEAQTGIRIHVHSTFDGRVPELIETQLFRIAQEALTNIVRHSRATEATLRLYCRNNWISLEISDNGVGFPTETPSGTTRKGMGLVGMQARVRHMQGKMLAENSPGGGAYLFFSLPLNLTSLPMQLEGADA